MDAFERTTKMANLMSFNLECVALVQVRGEADEESPSITIHSFWSSSAISGVNSEGFITTALPATSAASVSVAGVENG